MTRAEYDRNITMAIAEFDSVFRRIPPQKKPAPGSLGSSNGSVQSRRGIRVVIPIYKVAS